MKLPAGLVKLEALARSLPCPQCGHLGGRVEVEPAELLRRTTQRLPGFCGRSGAVDVSYETRPGGQEMVVRNRATWAKAWEAMGAEGGAAVLALIETCSPKCPACGVGAFAGPGSLSDVDRACLYVTLEMALWRAVNPGLPHPQYERDLPEPVEALATTCSTPVVALLDS